ncbi:MAG: CHAT domain-containing protein [Cyanobacteria bacterium P01_D01_bin.56]
MHYGFDHVQRSSLRRLYKLGCGLGLILGCGVGEPTMGQSIVPVGSTQVNQQPTEYRITGGQRSTDGLNVFHGFETFGLEQGERANFLVPAGVAHVLGRVRGGDISLINGQLQLMSSHADLFLLNPAGIIFGESATLALPGNFLATTAHEISFTEGTFPAIGTVDYAELVGDPIGLEFGANTAAVLINNGNLSVASGASLSLIGNQVINTGSLAGSTVTLASVLDNGSHYVRLSPTGSVLAYEVLPRQVVSGPAPLDLPSLLTQPSIASATGLWVNPDGSLQLAGSTLDVTNGMVLSTGTVTGNEVQLLGDRIGIFAGTITTQDGGNIWIGGNREGQGPLPNANSVYVSPDVTVTADGQGNHSGGNIIFWSEETSRIHGRISARGGNQGGNGGFVETSSRGFLEVTQVPDVSSAQGIPGMWLIDPFNIEIRANNATNENFTPGNPFNATGSPAVLDVGLLSQALGNGSVVVSTGDSGGENGNISLLDPLTYATAPGTTLELSAAGSIAINASITPANTTTSPLNLELQADRNDQGTGAVTFANNAVINTSGGSLLVRGNGEQIPGGAGVSLFAGTTVQTNGGNIDIVGRDGNGPGVLIEANTQLNTNSAGEILITGTSDTGIGIDFDSNVTTSSRLLSLDGQVGDTTRLAIQSVSPLVDREVQINSVGDVEVDSIDVQRSIDITTTNFLRVTGTNDQGQSLFAPDGIRISHGGAGRTPFTVGNSSRNGTAGIIATGPDNFINPVRSFLDSFSQGSIQIVTSGSTPNDCVEDCNDFDEENFDDDDFGEDDFGDDDVLEDGLDDDFDEDDSEDDGDFDEDENDFEDDDGFEDANDGLFEILEDAEVTAEELAIREKAVAQEYSQYLGVVSDRNLPLPEIQQKLNLVADQTGYIPGIVYVNFIPNPQTTAKQILELNQDNHLLELVLITGDASPQRLLIDTTKIDIQRVVRRLQRGVTSPSLGRRYLRPAQQLHSWIVSPLEDTLKQQNISHLAFVLPSGLRALPLAALHNGETFLVERYSLGIMPSVGLTNIDYTDVRPSEVLAAGASTFLDQPALPAVPLELRTIADTLWPGRFFLNESFTPEQLINHRQRGSYSILHLATHGEFRPGSPSNSYIQFWDRRVTLDQLPKLSLNNPPIDLLVLSACRTALGSREAELGFAGLAIQAGVKTALASLWRVDDVGTAGLMTEFYANLRNSTMRAEALRQAQLAMIQGAVIMDAGQLTWSNGTLTMPPVLAEEARTILKHPFYWAAFTLIGSPW